MKKSNLITLISLIVLIVVDVVFLCIWLIPSDDDGLAGGNVSYVPSVPANPSYPSGNTGNPENSTDTSDVSEAVSTDVSDVIDASDAETSSDESDSPDNGGNNGGNDIDTNTQPSGDGGNYDGSATADMNDALFIGDSRSVGLMEYAPIDGADYYVTVGMSVYNIYDKPADVPGIGKVTLIDLLNSHSYGKIYIMLGINEVGYPFGSTVKEYSALIDLIKTYQPDAVVFVQANLHVSQSRHNTDKVVNNTNINELNSRLSALADNESIFYIDANPIFDDDAGALAGVCTGDGTHLYAKYYAQWSEWIISQTAMILGE